MTTKTTPPAQTLPAPAPAPVEPANPAAGGCYVRNPITGELSAAQPPAPLTTPIPE